MLILVYVTYYRQMRAMRETERIFDSYHLLDDTSSIQSVLPESKCILYQLNAKNWLRSTEKAV